jgi:hypothetical protein
MNIASVLGVSALRRLFGRETANAVARHKPHASSGKMQYVLPSGERGQIQFHYLNNRQGIACHLRDADGNYIGAGFAYRNPKDRPCKETGRKLALTRALDDAGFGRESRARVWAAYHHRREEV